MAYLGAEVVLSILSLTESTASCLSMVLAKEPINPNTMSMEPALKTTSALSFHRRCAKQKLVSAPSYNITLLPHEARCCYRHSPVDRSVGCPQAREVVSQGGARGGADGAPCEGVGQVDKEGDDGEAPQAYALRRESAQGVVLEGQGHG